MLSTKRDILKKRFIMRVEILIEKVRKEKGLSLSALAKLVGMSKGHLSRIERGEGEPTISTLIRIAFALKVDEKELYKIIP